VWHAAACAECNRLRGELDNPVFPRKPTKDDLRFFQDLSLTVRREGNILK